MIFIVEYIIEAQLLNYMFRNVIATTIYDLIRDKSLQTLTQFM